MTGPTAEPPVVVIPRFAPLPLAPGEVSDLFELFVSVEDPQLFLRAVALFRDEQPLGGEAPTFQIKVGNGLLASVGPDSGEVPIAGADGEQVATITCEREPADIFLLTISILVKNAGAYRLRLRNNEQEAQRFVLVTSPVEQKTRRPWLVLKNPAEDAPGPFEIQSRSVRQIQVRNWGTAPLRFTDEAGTALGDHVDGPVTLKSRPEDPVAPHGLGVIEIECAEILGGRPPFVHTFGCDDPDKSHAQMTIRPKGEPPSPPEAGMKCQENCGCQEYEEPSTPGGPCARAICGHGLSSHMLQ